MMGHLAGLIQGNPAYDARIQQINGTPTFVGNGFSASLTRDGSHLDPRLHPYDLMNTHLTPGVRKLPSSLNLQMLQALRTSPITGTTPRVVRVTNGGLNIPANVVLSNTVIIVENGDINFNGSGHTFNNVMLIANNGNINLGNLQSTDLAVFASGSIHMNCGARFGGNSLLANGSSTGTINFNGATTTTAPGSDLRVIAQGNLTFNGNSTLFGSIDAKGEITFNGRATVVGV